MNTDEIVRHTRIFSGDAEKLMLPPGLKELLIEAADRLEELDERVAIMSESRTGTWINDGVDYDRGEKTNRWKCSHCGIWLLGQEKPRTKYCPACGVRMEG